MLNLVIIYSYIQHTQLFCVMQAHQHSKLNQQTKLSTTNGSGLISNWFLTVRTRRLYREEKTGIADIIGNNSVVYNYVIG